MHQHVGPFGSARDEDSAVFSVTRDRRGWMSSLYSKLDAWSRIRPRINFQDVQAVKIVLQVAELMISGCSFHDAQGNLLLTAKITHGATLCVPTLAVHSNNRRLISDHRL